MTSEQSKEEAVRKICASLRVIADELEHIIVRAEIPGRQEPARRRRVGA